MQDIALLFSLFLCKLVAFQLTQYVNLRIQQCVKLYRSFLTSIKSYKTVTKFDPKMYIKSFIIQLHFIIDLQIKHHSIFPLQD